MAAVGKEDPTQIEAAQILVNLQNRELKRWPEWVPVQPGGADTAATETEVKRSSAGTEAARVKRSREVASANTVTACVPEKWQKKKRSGWRGEPEPEPEPEQGHAAAAAANGSSAPRSSEQERCAEMPPASAQLLPVVAALCYAEVAVPGFGVGLPTSAAAPAGKEPMKTPSPNTPLDYGASGSGAPASADDAAPAQPQAGTGGGDEGCRSPAKRGPVAEEEKKPTTISVQPSVQSETRASSSSSKREPFPFDLNLPCDEDDGGCPDAT